MKQKNINLLLLLKVSVIVIALAICLCSKDRLAGGTETGNAKICGTLYLQDGKTPAQGAEVYLRRKTLPEVSSGSVKKHAEDIASVVTDANGKFTIDSVDTGIYVIEGISGNNMVLIDSIHKTCQDLGIAVSDTLKPAGAIKGFVKMAKGGNPSGTLVLAYGVNRFASVDSNGSFKFSTLARGRYNLSVRPLATAVNYGNLDTSAVPVKTGDTTNMDTLSLPYIVTPWARNVKTGYDSLKEIVTVTWSGADKDTVVYYNVYKKHSDSDTITLLNTIEVGDTAYNDSNTVEGSTYTYGVSCISNLEIESGITWSSDIKITSVYKFEKVFASTGSGNGEVLMPKGITRDNNGNIYIVDEGNTRVQKFDSAGNFILSFGSQGIDTAQFDAPKDVATDEWSNIYVIDNSQSSVQKFDSLGRFVKKWLTNGMPNGISIFANNAIWVATEADSSFIQEFDTGGALITEWKTASGNRGVVAKGSDTILVSSADNVITTYINGSVVGTITIPLKGVDCHFSINENGNIFIVNGTGYNFVRVFDSAGELVGRFGISGTGEGKISVPYSLYIIGKKIFLSSNNGVGIYLRP
jgi:phosphohistidine swiveling domain-containing protein